MSRACTTICETHLSIRALSRRRCGAGPQRSLGACGGSQCRIGVPADRNWGLSGNTTFIIGRRELTKGRISARRVRCLQSYDYREDPTDRWLGNAPDCACVVAQWINMEHYFSAVDNEVWRKRE